MAETDCIPFNKEDSAGPDIDLADYESGNQAGDGEEKEEYSYGGVREETFFQVLVEVRHQLDLATANLNSMMQRIGFILAFASILFVSASTRADFNYWWLAYSVCFLTVCATGIISVIFWRTWRIPLGADINVMTEIYLNKDYDRMGETILDEKLRAHSKVIYANEGMKILIIMQAAILILGLIAFFAEMIYNGLIQ